MPRSTENTNTSAYDKLRLDMMYIENYSPLLDIRLIILTLRIIFSKDSTEGIDVAMENQRRADELWRELDEENEEKEKEMRNEQRAQT